MKNQSQQWPTLDRKSRLLAFLMLALWTCATYAQTGARSAEPRPSEAWWAVAGTDGVQRINIRCGDGHFDPRHIVIRANVPVEMLVSTSSADLTPHSFVLDLSGPGASSAAKLDGPVGQIQKSFSFKHDQPGKYSIGCKENGSSGDSPKDEAKRGVLTIVQ
ncbi:hypothetical protein BH11PSE11_BH11PSE11_01620 [soil metagenome]